MWEAKSVEKTIMTPFICIRVEHQKFAQLKEALFWVANKDHSQQELIMIETLATRWLQSGCKKWDGKLAG